MSPTLVLLAAAAFAEPEAARREVREARATPDAVLLDFSAAWCNPCQQMNPIISKLEREGFPIRRVDIDQQKALAQQYGVASIPCFVLVVNGREQNRLTGRVSESELRRLLAQIPPVAPPARNPDPAPSPIYDDTEPAGSRPFPFPAPKPREPAAPSVDGSLNGQDPPPSTATGAGPLAASTRILVRDDKGINYGTGTIIDSKPGRTVILTCSHIFRNMTESATIEVDVFEGKKPRKHVGKLVAVDKEGDVGLIEVPTDGVLPAIRVGSLDAPVTIDADLVSIGCNGGEAPTVLKARVTKLNRYAGPDNVECTGLPVAGRSGGGLFTASGELVGICFAADQKERRGLYAGLKPIHALLARGLKPSATADELAESPFNSKPGKPARTLPRSPARDEAPTDDAFPDDGAELPFGSLGKSTPDEASGSNDLAAGSLDAAGAAAVAAAGEAEVICIIRPRSQQDASRVVIINKASPRFLNYLQGELRSQPKPTSGRIELPESRGNAKEVEPQPSRETTVRVANHEYERLERYVRSREAR